MQNGAAGMADNAHLPSAARYRPFGNDV